MSTTYIRECPALTLIASRIFGSVLKRAYAITHSDSLKHAKKELDEECQFWEEEQGIDTENIGGSMSVLLEFINGSFVTFYIEDGGFIRSFPMEDTVTA
jgi:hypothetical protein